jgi:pimeloyl-ACP methyl ester carboxylesterase
VTGDVEYAADCGTLVVPENRADPDSRLIALPLTRIHGTGATPGDPIFWLAGGPGQSNMRFSHPQDLDALIENHDFVLVGYRGVDGQVSLDCPEVSKAMRDPPGEFLSDAALESYGAAAAQCAERLTAAGVDLAAYSMPETIDDVEAARKALGYARINLLSVSYGTRLAMIYEWIYPESLHRVIMLEVNTPGHFVWEPEILDAQIGDYARLCAQDVYCSARTGDLAGTMREVSDSLPERWLFSSIDEGKVKLITFVMFHETIQVQGNPFPLHGPAAVDLWLDVAKGNRIGLVLASTLSDLFIPDMFTWGHLLSIGSGTGEYDDPARDYRAELDPPDSILGSPMALLLWGMGAGWPVHPLPQEILQLQSSDVETLMEAGSLDMMTPPVGAQELLPYLNNGELVILKEFGHGNTFWNSQPEARVHMLTTFYESGRADDSRYVYQALDFDVGGGWTGMARTVLTVVSGLALLLVTLVALLIRFVVRRVRRRRASGSG